MTRHISIEDYRAAMAKPAARSKYGAKKVICDGHTFDSHAEMRRYQELKLLQHAGKIRDLVLQPSYSIETGIYTADFRYVDAQGVTHVEDVKGHATDACRMRLKLMAKLGVLVELITEESHPHLWKKS